MLAVLLHRRPFLVMDKHKLTLKRAIVPVRTSLYIPSATQTYSPARGGFDTVTS